MLEIGCGDGRLTWKYARQTRSVLAIDADRITVVAAQAMLPGMRLPTRVDFAQAAAESLPARRESFDLAIFAWSL
ncbi:MAG: class I SAM-dependent methyltransferase [Anaerolineales bacterium]